jgi:hypothetical protein
MVWTALGWVASAVLVATIGYQVVRQWRTGHSEGVSRWLYVGQICASSGFVAYSAHLGDAVFIATNSVILIAAILGLVSVLRQRDATSPPSTPR